MILVTWTFFIVASLLLLLTIIAWTVVLVNNFNASFWDQEKLTTYALIRGWIAFVVFVVTAGILFGGLFR